MSRIADLDTPAALVDTLRMQRNIERMQARMDAFGVRFRPHVKTTKCLPVVREQLAAGAPEDPPRRSLREPPPRGGTARSGRRVARGITVSTLKEAEQFFAAGIDDILYAVGMVPGKLGRALALRRAGCDLKLLVDNIAAARAMVTVGREQGEAFEAWIEIDTDDHRSGIVPDDDALLEVAAILRDGGMKVGGVMTHAGSSYDCSDRAALVAVAERERFGAVRAAERLRQAGHDCPVVSVGSTPTALSAERLDGVTEVRAGVYVFFDLVMRNVGVCDTRDIALSVLTTVIGHQADKGWAIVDAGWMALSRDRGTQKQAYDYGYGQVCSESGEVLEGYVVSGANQEHGIVSLAAGVDTDIVGRFPLGTRLRVLPNHACATGAQYPEYHAVDGDGATTTWPRFYGW
jgi:D-serine deaminase-like pyridoxal phosphate-dependent protein